jgi:hypothetical protein
VGTVRLQPLVSLPTSTPSRLKAKWSDIVREVSAQGAVAIKSGSAVGVVILSAEAYCRLVKVSSTVTQPEPPDLEDLSVQFNRRRARLQETQARRKLHGVLDAKGKAKRAPVVGRRSK